MQEGRRCPAEFRQRRQSGLEQAHPTAMAISHSRSLLDRRVLPGRVPCFASKRALPGG